jgi:hypothetical protein
MRETDRGPRANLNSRLWCHRSNRLVSGKVPAGIICHVCTGLLEFDGVSLQIAHWRPREAALSCAPEQRPHESDRHPCGLLGCSGRRGANPDCACGGGRRELSRGGAISISPTAFFSAQRKGPISLGLGRLLERMRCLLCLGRGWMPCPRQSGPVYEARRYMRPLLPTAMPHIRRPFVATRFLKIRDFSIRSTKAL